MEPRRRQIIVDDDLPGGIALGAYMPPGSKPSTVSLAQYTRSTTENPIVRGLASIASTIQRPISVIKSFFEKKPAAGLPAALAAPPQLPRLTMGIPSGIAPGPAPIDRMRMLGTVHVRDTPITAGRPLLPNTPTERIADFAAKVKDKIPSIPMSTITSALEKMKLPAAIALGVAAVAAIIYGGYRLYKHFKKPDEVPTPAGVAAHTPDFNTILDELALTRPHLSTSEGRISALQKLRALAETSTADQFMERVAGAF